MIYLDNENKTTEKKKIKIKESYFKYINRMSSRSTPFGLFSACSLGKIGLETNFAVNSCFVKKIRLDTSVAFGIHNQCNQLPEIRNKIKFFPNNTLYKIKGYFRYIEAKVKANNSFFSISSVKISSELKKVLKKAENGACFNELVNELVSIDVERIYAESYIEDLIASNIILSEFSTSLTREDNFFPLTFTDRIMSDIEEDLYILNKKISKLDLKKVNDVSLYENIYRHIRTITNEEDKTKPLLQVDLFRETKELSLGKDIIEELQDVLTFILEHGEIRSKSVIREFQEEFYKRYEDQEVPLPIALDPDIGIGYPANYGVSDNPHIFISSLEALRRNTSQNSGQDNISQILLSKLSEEEERGTIKIDFKDVKKKTYEKKDHELPETIYMFFQIIKKENDRPLIYLKGVGAGGANLLSRFSHLDKNLNSLVNEIARKEEEMHKDCIVGEIIHLPPDSRVGNILKRGTIRSHEIEFFTMSELDKEFRIPVSDIMISIRKGRIFLRSKKNNKQIIPKLTTAHNFYNDTLPIYKFLCDLQYHNTFSGFVLNPLNISKHSKFVPRISLGRTIISLATWVLNEKEFSNLPESKFHNSFIKEWRLKRNIPEKVLLINGDNELFIDFSCPISVKILLLEVRKRKNIEIKEFIFGRENLLVKDEKGYYLNECIVPFYRKKK